MLGQQFNLKLINTRIILKNIKFNLNNKPYFQSFNEIITWMLNYFNVK
jgi:hypothetical protein